MILLLGIKIFLLAVFRGTILRSVELSTVYHIILQNASLTCAPPIDLAQMLKFFIYPMVAELTLRCLSIRATCPPCLMPHMILTLDLLQARDGLRRANDGRDGQEVAE
jgi:hypothetical protein